MHAQDENNPMLYRRIHARNRVPPGGQSLLSKRRRHGRKAIRVNIRHHVDEPVTKPYTKPGTWLPR